MAVPHNSVNKEFEATYTFGDQTKVTTTRTDRLPSTSLHVLEEIDAEENIVDREMSKTPLLSHPYINKYTAAGIYIMVMIYGPESVILVMSIPKLLFREGNSCAVKLANMGHEIQGSIWLETLLDKLHMDFYRDRIDLPNYRFP
ncbi:transmembrane protein, putative [Medicago truncatula]|uniref:Transmembrane protein, putative n=1 Tax=Medicago truncatula TaxID=3880 RepID=A0A072UJS3_MEDTR|nr:transmembrane protein, putative [Medicago truncatula]